VFLIHTNIFDYFIDLI